MEKGMPVSEIEGRRRGGGRNALECCRRREPEWMVEGVDGVLRLENVR